MSTWSQVLEALKPKRPEILGDDIVKLSMLVLHEGNERTQFVFVSREVMPPMLEMMQIKAAFSLNGEVDLSGLVRQFGGLVVGSLGFTPTGDQHGGGILALEANIPLTSFAVSDPINFLIYLHVFATAADTIERTIFGSRSPLQRKPPSQSPEHH